MESLISGEQNFQLAAVLLSMAAFGFWVDGKKFGQKFSGALILLFLGMVLANLKVIPHSAPAYGFASSFLVPLAIPMLLFRANLKEVFQEIGPVLKAFIASAAILVVSVLIIVSIFDFGELETIVASTLTASYIGGSLNFVATAQTLGLDDPTQFAAALTADTLGAIFFISLLMLLPAMSIMRKAMPSKFIAEGDIGLEKGINPHVKEDGPAFNLVGFSFAIATSMVICGLADTLTQYFGLGHLYILTITVLALIVANFFKPLVDKFSSEFEIGTYFMYIFFVALGAGADLYTVVGSALPYVLMIISSIIVFFIILLFVGRLLKLDLAELMVAANACILGPATAAAMAAGKGWKKLITPAMLAGVLGYSVATFIGVAMAKLLD